MGGCTRSASSTREQARLRRMGRRGQSDQIAGRRSVAEPAVLRKASRSLTRSWIVGEGRSSPGVRRSGCRESRAGSVETVSSQFAGQEGTSTHIPPTIPHHNLVPRCCRDRCLAIRPLRLQPPKLVKTVPAPPNILAPGFSSSSAATDNSLPSYLTLPSLPSSLQQHGLALEILAELLVVDRPLKVPKGALRFW